MKKQQTLYIVLIVFIVILLLQVMRTIDVTEPRAILLGLAVSLLVMVIAILMFQMRTNEYKEPIVKNEHRKMVNKLYDF